MLKGIRVLDLADEQGSYCSKLLADLGADVIKVEGPAGDPLRLSKPYVFLYQNSNKSGVSVEFGTDEGTRTFQTLIQNSDVLIETFGPAGLEALGIGRPQPRRLNRELVHLSISPFGQTGPRSEYQASDAVVSALGGQLFLSGRASEPPRELFTNQPFYTVSLYGAVAVLLRLRKRKITGKGSYIDMSVQEAVASALGNTMTDFFSNGVSAERGNRNNSEGFVILPSNDGYVQVNVLGSWDTLLELMAAEGKAGVLLQPQWSEAFYRTENFRQAVEAVGNWTRGHTTTELFELGQEMRFPWAPVRMSEEVLHCPQLQSRNFYTRFSIPEEDPELGDYEVAVPGFPCKFSACSLPATKLAPDWGEHNDSIPALTNSRNQRNDDSYSPGGGQVCLDGAILHGLRVLDLTRILSGPYAARILADFGAEVIKVQSEKTAQGAEQNETPAFCAWNRNKQSLFLDLDEPESREVFLKMISSCDVVIENYSPRVMENWGLDYNRLKEISPKLVMLSISAMGHTGPWRDYVGLAPTFHALSGLLRPASQKLPEADPSNPYADVIAGLYATLALLAALEYRGKTGLGQHIDLSAMESLCTLAGIDAKWEARDSTQEPVIFPHSGVYRCAGEDRWCVITLKDEDEYRLLCSIAGVPELTMETIGCWTATRTPESVMDLLQESGIAAGVAQNAADLAKDPQLRARRFFVSLKHPVIGKVVSDRSALWNWRVKPRWKPSR